MPLHREPLSFTPRSRGDPAEKPLPDGFTTIRDILNEPMQVGHFRSVIGLVKDMRAPISTKGTDWKSTLTILDKSTEEDGTGLTVNIFRPKGEMPQPNAGDVVHVFRAKVSNYLGELGLITNWATEIYVFTAAEIPKPPRSAEVAMKRTRSHGREPSVKELEHVSWFYHTINKDALPSAADFQVQVEQSRYVKDKFCTLDGVQDGRFCDVVAQVIKEPYDQMDKVTLWVSDYAENNSFFKFSWDGSDNPSNCDGDPFGYTSGYNNNPSRGWPGPFGKRSMQVTCFEPHATYIRAEVKAGDWVKLRNLQIKFGRNNNNLEGFLREDRVFTSKLQVELIDTKSPESIDERLKAAIRRKLAYEKKAQEQKKKYAANERGKRKADRTEDAKPNSKQKRNASRAATFKRIEDQELKRASLIGLNELIKCESQDQPVFPLSKILEPIPYSTTIDGQEAQLTLPFTNAKYLANVRVVDYRPRKLEDFAVWRKNIECDILTDHSGDSDSGSDDDNRGITFAPVKNKTWEWRFALQLEEAGLGPRKKDEPERLWVMVDNTEAQLLVNLDACDLRDNPNTLTSLREQLFKLWGNLEESKTLELENHVQSRKRLEAHEPPPDSSDNEQESGDHHTSASKEPGKVSNKPFACCLRQYGSQMPESDPSKWDAGEGKRYERIFGLFGTKIS